MRETIGVVIIRDGYILLVQKNETWILPGGKPEAGELDRKCLVREVKEELEIGLRIRSLVHIGGDFIGKSPHIGDTICLRIYLYLAEISGEIIPSAEIGEATWTNSPESYKLAESTEKAICFLRQNGYL